MITCARSRVISPPPIMRSISGRMASTRSCVSTHSTTIGRSSESTSIRSVCSVELAPKPMIARSTVAPAYLRDLSSSTIAA